MTTPLRRRSILRSGMSAKPSSKISEGGAVLARSKEVPPCGLITLRWREGKQERNRTRAPIDEIIRRPREF